MSDLITVTDPESAHKIQYHMRALAYLLGMTQDELREDTRTVDQMVSAVCVARGITRAQLAREMGTSNPTLTYLTRYSINPGVRSIINLASALNESPVTLFNAYARALQSKNGRL